MKYITEKEKLVQRSMGIWAIPSEDPEKPFTMELSANVCYHWRDAAILVAEVDIEYEVPAGVNLVQNAHETLNLKEQNALKDYTDRMAIIAKQREHLLMLTHHVEEGDFVNEL